MSDKIIFQRLVVNSLPVGGDATYSGTINSVQFTKANVVRMYYAKPKRNLRNKK